MLNYLNKKYDKYYDKFMKKAKKYALKKFVRSEYLKETTSILPLTLITIVTRSIFNFLITSRLKIDIYVIDFTFSLFVTVIFSVYSPYLYNLFNKNLKEDVEDFSKFIIDSFWKEGWVFYEYWKVRILGTLGTIFIILLFFVEINSVMIQEFIIHTMISSAIVDYLNNLYLEKDAPKVKIIEKTEIVESYYPEEKLKKTNSLDFLIIEDYESYINEVYKKHV